MLVLVKSSIETHSLWKLRKKYVNNFILQDFERKKETYLDLNLDMFADMYKCKHTHCVCNVPIKYMYIWKHNTVIMTH